MNDALQNILPLEYKLVIVHVKLKKLTNSIMPFQSAFFECSKTKVMKG